MRYGSHRPGRTGADGFRHRRVFDVYNNLGFGFLEHLYIMALERELLARNHEVARQVCVNVMYKGVKLGVQRLDMIVDRKLIVEIKSTFILHPAATRQVYNYLRGTNLEVGLLLHFGPEPRVHRMLCRNGKSTKPSDSGAAVDVPNARDPALAPPPNQSQPDASGQEIHDISKSATSA